MVTLGIAGHVDHGKTSLVRALTGMETDRLPEEQRRGISIELGFAWLDLPLPDGSVERVALVDMPGHERFVRRMIAGAAAIDAVILVVAADEGVMPQGREHLAICQLLGVRAGAVILTKVDLADEEMRALAQDDVASLVAGTFLSTARVLPFSARQPETLGPLRQGLAELVSELVQKRNQEMALDHRPFLMAIDRCFSVPGRGTVVTGTAAAGQVTVDQFLEALPQGQTWRVRGAQQQGEPHNQIKAPGRVALNLAAASTADLPVGTTLVAPGTVVSGDRFDAVLTLLPHTKGLPVRSRAQVHLGTYYADAAVVQLSGTAQPSGSTALVQVQLDRPLPLPPQEPFVLRGSQTDARYGQTLGGGRLLLPMPRRHKLGDGETLAQLGHLIPPELRLPAADAPGRAASAGLDQQILALAGLSGWRGVSEKDLVQQCAAPPQAQQRALKALLANGLLRKAGQPAHYLTHVDMLALELKITTAVGQFHREQPTRAGIDSEALARAAGEWLDPSVVIHVAQNLNKRNVLTLQQQLWSLPGFQPKATASPAQLAQVMQALAAAGLAAPSPAVLADAIALELRDVQATLTVATAQGLVVRIAEDYWLPRSVANEAADRVIAAFAGTDSFSTGELKELLGLTRKHLIPFAEWLDAERVSVRDPAGTRRIRDRALQAWRSRQPSVPVES